MSFRPKNAMRRRALIACTAVSLLGVGSVFVDHELAHGQLWRQVAERLRDEAGELAPVLGAAISKAAAALAREEAEFMTLGAAVHADAGAGAHHIMTASMTAMAAPFPEPEAERPEINRQLKGDRLALAEIAMPKLVLPEPEPLPAGASAALFLLSPSIAAPALTPAVPAPAQAQAALLPAPEAEGDARLATGPLMASTRAPFIHPPAKNPFVNSAAASSVGLPNPATGLPNAAAGFPNAAAGFPNATKITWADLVRMASMKGGDGEEPNKIFGALSEKEFRAREVRCMATAIYFEARGESVRGQIAVGQVIMNRLRSDFYPKTICGVVYQGQWNRNACQFSFACDGQTDAPKEPEQWKIALDVAKQVISGKAYLSDIGEATHYHAVYVRPDWRRDVRKIKQLGVHIFYKAPFVKPLASDPDYQAL